MNRVLVLVVLVLVVVVPAAGAATPRQQVARLQAQLAKVKRTDAAAIAKLKKTNAATVTGLQTQVTGLQAQVATIAGLNASITTLTADKATLAAQAGGLSTQVVQLTAQVTAQAQGGLAAVLAGNPLDLWNAVTAIWQVFPNETSTLCGYQKSNYLFQSSSFTHTEYDFSAYTACAP